MDDLRDTIRQFSEKRLLVVGDLMLDHYTFGEVGRVSPEAPVPVLRKTAEERVLGGAANVAHNAATLGAHVVLCGLIGDDPAGESLRCIAAARGIDAAGVLVDTSRPTTVKHRIVAQGYHQLLRVDHEEVRPVDQHATVFVALSAFLTDAIAACDAVVCSDYAKGMFAGGIAQAIVARARAARKPVIVDAKPSTIHAFRGASVIKPNRKEALEMTGAPTVEAAGPALARALEANLVVTLGGDGMQVFRGDGASQRIAGRPIQVYDVTGAGDTALAVLALGVASGVSLEDAAAIANIASAIVVQKPRTATVSCEELASGVEFHAHVEAVDIVPKVWGHERWLENNERYCSKLLSLKQGYQCSLHYHKEKDEMFIVTRGHVRLELGDRVLHMRPGNFVRIPPGAKHRFTGIEDSLIIEVSTHHDEADSYRLEESRKCALKDIAVNIAGASMPHVVRPT